MATKKQKENKGLKMVIVSVADTAAIFGVTDRAIRKWVESGCPKQAYGKMDLVDVLPWWIENIHTTKAEQSDEGISEAKRKYWNQKAERERLTVEERKGNLIPLADIKESWVARMREVSAGLQALSFRVIGLIAPYLRDPDEKETVRAIIDREQWLLRDGYCRGGKFCPADDGGKKK